MRTFAAIALLLAGSLSADELVGLHVDLKDLPRSRSCGFVIQLLCSDREPVTPFDRPTCSEYEQTYVLIEAIDSDPSAIELLRSRYETTFTHGERHRIAGALLGRVPDDRRYWNELEEHAAYALRETRGVDSDGRPSMAMEAFRIAAGDPRGRPLVLGALQSNDVDLLSRTLAVIVRRRDESFLPAIEAMLERLPEHAEVLAMWVTLLGSDAADRVASRFLSASSDCETMDCNP